VGSSTHQVMQLAANCEAATIGGVPGSGFLEQW